MSDRCLLLTGATGFVGARVAALAVRRGWQVIALLTPSDDGTALAGLEERLHIVRGTVAGAKSWGDEVARLGPEACLHLAWNTSPGVYLETAENLDWLSWSIQLFSQLPRWGVRHIVGVGTCAEYDADFGYLREATPARPLTLYAACKMGLRLTGEQLARQANLPFAWARIFHVYGPGEHPRRLVASCIRALLAGERFETTDGTQIRDFLHVDDVAAGLLAVIETRHAGDINICSGQPVSVRTLLESIGATVGHRELLAIGARAPSIWDPPFLCGENTRLRSLGWRQSFSLDEGLADAVRWWCDRDKGTLASFSKQS